MNETTSRDKRKNFWIMVFVVLAFCAIPLLIGMIPKGYWIIWRLRDDGYDIQYDTLNGSTSSVSPAFGCMLGIEKKITNETLELLTQLPYLEAIRLNQVDFEALDLNWLTKISKLNLVKISLPYNLREEELQKLGQCPQLSALFIGSVPISGETIQQWKRCPLQKLQLGTCGLTDTELEQIVSLFPDLIYLNVLGNPGITDAALEHLTKLEHLEMLRLPRTSVTDEEIENFQKKHPNPKLKIRHDYSP